MIFWGFSSFAHSANQDLITGKDIPQLLGVWYGTYALPNQNQSAEMWMEVAYQRSVNGWDIAGFNRWNVVSDTTQSRHGADSMGKNAEHFDRFSGKIQPDKTTVLLTEAQRGAKLQATLTGPDAMQVVLTAKGDDTALFATTLQRIDTHYAPGETTSLGVDVSHHSGDVDWVTVREQGYQFAYVKASEGMDNPDARFAEHWAALKKLGMPRGAYHFYVTEDDPDKQVAFFLSRLGDDPGELPPVVDIELLGKGTTGDMSAPLKRFLAKLAAGTGMTPMIYTRPKFWAEHYEPEFGRYHLWLSEYGVKMPKVPFGWTNWTLWQNVADQAIKGVEKSADVSLLHPQISLETLHKPKP